MAANLFSSTSSYDEIPWQFVLRNPLLNSEKYALKIAKAMNDGYNGLKFEKICSYQNLDEEVLKLIIDKIIVKEKSDKAIFDFLIDHIELVSDRERLEILYPEIEAGWRCYDAVLKMLESHIKLIQKAKRRLKASMSAKVVLESLFLDIACGV